MLKDGLLYTNFRKLKPAVEISLQAAVWTPVGGKVG